jgi:hypothetical protein
MKTKLIQLTSVGIIIWAVACVTLFFAMNWSTIINQMHT